MTARHFTLKDTDATVGLGYALGKQIASMPTAIRVILFYGELGTGKTTLTRGLISALPGGDAAEVSSPSFTLCNSYPTTPPVLHCDLYRHEGPLPDEIDEALENPHQLILIEWSERLDTHTFSEGYLAEYLMARLDIHLETCDGNRLATLTPYGDAAQRIVGSMVPHPESG